MIAPRFGAWKKSIISWEMWYLQWLQAGVIPKTYLQYGDNRNIYIHDFFLALYIVLQLLFL